MISIIVCSVNQAQLHAFSQSVEATIGVPYELIRIDNGNNEYSLCQAYNKGKALAQYNVLCFSHEDISFHTQNWGKLLVELLKDPAIGMAGVLGICYFGMFPIGYYDANEFEGQLIVGGLQGAPTHSHIRFPSNNIAEVAGIDGLFMATRKEVMERFHFSEDILKGFHGYDVDINMQIRQHYKIVITRNLLLYHHSGGAFNDAYYEAMRVLAGKWRHQLPAHVPFYSKKEIVQLKLRSLHEYYRRAGGKKNALNNHRVAIRYALRQKVLLPWLMSLFTFKN